MGAGVPRFHGDDVRFLRCDGAALAAVPAAFLVSAIAGYFCERLIICRLYGRPLETLLATWGLSLILIQAARVYFGDTLSVASPTWLQGGWEVAPDLVLPSLRLFIIGFCAVCIVIVYIVIRFTSFGLLLRATTQNREIASALGVSTRRVDGLLPLTRYDPGTISRDSHQGHDRQPQTYVQDKKRMSFHNFTSSSVLLGERGACTHK